MVVSDYIRAARRDLALLQSNGACYTRAGKGHLGYSMAPVAARYAESVAAILHFMNHGNLPRWAQ